MEVADFELSYREVIPDQTSTGARRDITVNTGTFSRLCVSFKDAPIRFEQILFDLIISLFKRCCAQYTPGYKSDRKGWWLLL